MERFADIQILRYKLKGFEKLSLKTKLYIYYLSEAALWGRDITFDQFGKHNLEVRQLLEYVYVALKDKCEYSSDADRKIEFDALTTYLKRIWFANGVYHHYACDKFVPEFSEDFLRKAIADVDATMEKHTDSKSIERVCKIIFDKDYLPKRVNKKHGDDLVLTSACNYYRGVTQGEAEEYYRSLAKGGGDETPSYGLNSMLVKDDDGTLREEIWNVNSKYGEYIQHIIDCLKKAKSYAENNQQKKVIDLLTEYYITGDLSLFDQYSIEWLNETEGDVDFINGFIEVYGDPLGIKASWEAIVEYKDKEACERTQKICNNAQWFEDHSPVAPQFKKKEVKGVTANVIRAAMLGGDEYPSTAIGINLPNADWIRARYGSKSVTISNLTEAYDEAAKGNGFLEEFVADADIVVMIRKYGDKTDNLHTDLHECLGHGSGQLLEGTDPNALKNYGSTIEEARADLFGLYYIADDKLIELGLLDDNDAHKAQYYTYMLNGLMTQCVRIKPGCDIEEAHMRNRALIANWCMERCGREELPAMNVEQRNGKTFLRINDYGRLRQLFAELLAEVQRIKSEGDLEAARELVENYGVKINRRLHDEILSRYETLNIAPYKGFLNPRLELVKDESDNVTDVVVDYSETMEEQMLRYGRDYSMPCLLHCAE